MIISILNQKGGVGKTTLSIHIAYGLQEKGYKVLLIDADPQGSSRDWHEASECSVLKVVGIDRPTIHKDINLFKKDYDYILIDGPARLGTISISALKCSDIVLIPIQPSPVEIWATEGIIEMAREEKTLSEKQLKIFLIINMMVKNTHLGNEIRTAIEQSGLTALNSVACFRQDYRKCFANGSTVIKENPNSEASKEIITMVEEIINLSGV